MVYFPKPGLAKEQGSELVGSTLLYFVQSTVVAVTGGSLAFAVNGTAVALSSGASLLFLMMLLPFVLFSPVNVMCMFFNDLICWYKGKEGGVYILRYFLTLLMQFIACILAPLFTWIYLSDGGPIHLGLSRTPAGTSDATLFFGLTVSSLVFTLAWLVVSENMTALYSYGMAQLRAAAEAKLRAAAEANKPGPKSRDARKNVLPNKGQLHLTVATAFRAICVSAIMIGLVFFIQPVLGYCMNPFQYIGYTIVSWHWDSNWWIHFFAPFAGGFLAYLLYLPYTFASTWGPLTKYYGRRAGNNALFNPGTWTL